MIAAVIFRFDNMYSPSSRTTSVPLSPVVADQQKLSVHRCSSTPYFSGPMKEPPRYDEAIKIKQQQIVGSLI